MRTLRHYFISDSLDEVQKVEAELIEQQVQSTQFHVMSRDEEGMHERELNSIHSLLRRDLWRSGLVGASTGAVLAMLVLVGAATTGLTAFAAGWTPFIFLAIVVFGFSTWEGGLYGIQEPSKAFAKFAGDLDAGKHVIFVDAEQSQKIGLLNVMQNHDRLKLEEIEVGRPAWFLRLLAKVRNEEKAETATA